MDYIRDMAIDVTALDVEWAEQAELATKWAQRWLEAQDAADKAEEFVKYTRSRLIRRATKNPDACLGKGLKPTEIQLEAYYRTHADYIAAKDDWLDKVKIAGDLLIAKNEISFTRKAALEHLVILHGQSYFAGPNVPRNIKTELETRKKIRERNNQDANGRIRKFERK